MGKKWDDGGTDVGLYVTGMRLWVSRLRLWVPKVGLWGTGVRLWGTMWDYEDKSGIMGA